jgi:N-acetylglucosaminyldiphosphoundecaprenol N-acetyl-beta-D-mannosaminyltransferase
MDKIDGASNQATKQREVVCLLGLPIDVLDMNAAMARVRHAVSSRQRLFLSTPNLNFLVAAQSNPEFRDSVLRSDLSVADGMSIVLLGRLLGCRLPERVTGSDLFEQLALSDEHPPIRVYFFGGPPGAGKQACERINSQYRGVVCVGHDEAGYGDVASMSTPEVIDRINASGADFVVAALGAQKGQAWLMHNQHRLQAPVISHLGAVVNFMAGSVSRSPKWLQRIGLEWVWRIVQEPALWRRYWHDGWAFVSLLARYGIPNALAERSMRHVTHGHAQIVADISRDNTRTLVLEGLWLENCLEGLRSALSTTGHHRSIRVDLAQVSGMGVHALGLLTSVHGRLQSAGRDGITLCNVPEPLRRQIRASGASYLIEECEMALVEAHSGS